MRKNKPICYAPNCESVSWAKGLCNKHYKRLRAFGDMNYNPRDHTPQKKFIESALNSNTDKCITWPFKNKRGGYGRARHNGKEWQVNRLIATLAHGNPPLGYLACHVPVKCHNRLCCNPRHIYWGTAKENSSDANKDGTQIRGVRVHTAKLTETQVKEIRKDSRNHTETAKSYNVQPSTISRIRSGQRWAWVD